MAVRRVDCQPPQWQRDGAATSSVPTPLNSAHPAPLRAHSRGEAFAPRVSPSREAFDFGECAQYERAELPFTLTNHAPLPVAVRFSRAANFSVSPASLTLPASGTAAQHGHSLEAALVAPQPTTLPCVPRAQREAAVRP